MGGQVLTGNDAVRNYMAQMYTESPKIRVENLVTEGDFVIATGKINLKNKAGVTVDYAYCDVWQLQLGALEIGTHLFFFVMTHNVSCQCKIMPINKVQEFMFT